MAFQSKQLVARNSVPNLASSIIASSDKLVPRLVESAIRQRKNVGPQDLEQEEVAGVVSFQLLNELCDIQRTEI